MEFGGDRKDKPGRYKRECDGMQATKAGEDLGMGKHSPYTFVET